MTGQQICYFCTSFVITMPFFLYGMHSMARTAVYQIRLDEQEKQQAFAVLRELGVSPAQAIRVFLRQVVATRSIPFMIEQPNIMPTLPTTLTTPSPANPPQASIPIPTDHDVFDHLDGLLDRL
jgi:addiction module RelB/DinJ family antitoxin